MSYFKDERLGLSGEFDSLEEAKLYWDIQGFTDSKIVPSTKAEHDSLVSTIMSTQDKEALASIEEVYPK